MRFRHVLICVLLSLLVAGCAQQAAQPTAIPTAAQSGTGAKQALVIGAINPSPSKRISAMQPLADYLAGRLAGQGIVRGEVKIAQNIDAMVQMMQAGEVDVFFDTAYTALTISSQTGAQPSLRWWKGGQAEYHTVFLTRADSSITSLDQVKGAMVGFEQAFSTSGYFVPRTYLSTNGYKVKEFDDAKASVPADTIGYAFSGSSDNTIQWLVSGRVPVGVVNNSEYAELPAETRATLRVLVETEPIPRAVVLINSQLDSQLQQAVTAILTGMNSDGAAQSALEAFDGTSQFDVLAAEQQKQLQSLYALSQQ
ncbi:MAG TPA: phosphate/phosphite/phosphonate ABC transporter substrate-binding protein [Herpetosiphonaceae bacterium]|nr:phosphate/phosphite/phosphonate ABC transporter substrate-binding protein [Herpetosiphonaceae bacterium]